MTAIRTILAALVIGLGAGAAIAQDAPTAPPPDLAPGSTADMSGQRVYNSDGNWLGTVTGMTTDAHGQRLAAVTIEHAIGIRGTTVLFPEGSLQPREAGGYMTNLNGDQIKQLPRANATNTP